VAWIRQLPSGLWAATYRTPDGRRRTITGALKSQVSHAVGELERQVRSSDWIDPDLALITVSDWWERVRGTRRLSTASAARDESHWRAHVEPHWGRRPIGSILRPDVRGWVVQMERAGVGGWTIQAALKVLRVTLESAVDARLIRANPAAGVRGPRPAAHQDRVLDPSEDGVLLAALETVRPGDPSARLFVELLLYCGLRWEEAAAVRRERVLMRAQAVDIGPVVERGGTIRPYPKSPAGKRHVPVDGDLWPILRAHALTVEPGGLLFTAPGGGVLRYPNWRNRVWVPAVAACTPPLDAPVPTAHDLRHTYGTRLADAGVPVHDIMALMGHERLISAQRYLHAGDARMDRARAAMRAARRSSSDSQLTHDLEERGFGAEP
jgi:integrase